MFYASCRISQAAVCLYIPLYNIIVRPDIVSIDHRKALRNGGVVKQREDFLN